MIRELITRLSADTQELERGLQKGKKEVSGFEAGIKKIGAAIAAAFAFDAVIGAIQQMITDVTTFADRMQDLQEITGVNTTKLQEFQYVAKIAGVEVDVFSSAVQGLTQRLARGGEDAGPLGRAFEALGMTARDANGELRKGGDIVEEAIAKLSQMENITQRNVIGAQVFGGAWREMAPILSLGSQEIERLRKEAHELGVVLSGEQLQAADDLRVQVVQLDEQWKTFSRNIVTMVAPALTGLLNSLNTIWNNIRNNIKEPEYLTVEMVDAAINNSKRIIQETRRLWADEAGNLYGTPARIVEENEKAISNLMKRRAELVAEQAAADAKEAEQAQATAEANRAIEAQAERERQAADARAWQALGDIGRKQKEIADAEAAVISANSDAERQYHQLRVNNLKEELRLLQESRDPVNAFLASRPGADMGAPAKMQGITTQPITIEPQIVEMEAYAGALGSVEQAHIRAKIAAEAHQKSMEKLTMVASDAAYSIGMAFGEMAATGEKATGRLIAQAIAQAVASLMKHFAATLPPPLSIAAIAGAGLFAGVMKAQIPAFAEGGIVSGPTLGLIGEYTNARSNPEVVAPLSKLKDYLGGGNKVEFEIRGDRLWGVLKKYENRLRTNA